MSENEDQPSVAPEAFGTEAAGAQATRPEALLLPAKTSANDEGVRPASLDAAIEAAMSGPRGFGAVALLSAAWARQESSRADELSRKLTQSEEKVAALNEELRRQYGKISALEARNSESSNHKPVLVVAIIVGQFVFGAGLDAMKSAATKDVGLALIISAAALLFFGLWPFVRPAKKTGAEK